MNGSINAGGYYNGFGVFLLDGTSRNNDQTVGPGAGLSPMTNVAGAVRIDSTSTDFYAIGGNGTASSTWATQTTAVAYASVDRFIEFKLTSSNSMNVTIYSDSGYTTALGRAMNVTLNNTGGIDSFALANRSGQTSSSADSFFFGMQVQDTGTVELGYFATTGTTVTPGLIANGLSADSTSVVRTNSVFVGGDAGSIVVLNQANTYGGNTTVNLNGTARAANSSAFGTNGTVSVTSGGRIQMSNGITLSRALTLNGSGISSSGALQNVNGSNTWQGNVTLGGASSIASDSGVLTLSGTVGLAGNRLTVIGNSSVTASGQLSGTGGSDVLKQGSGTLTLGGDNSGLNPSGGNSIFIDEGTVYLNHNNAAGASAKRIDLGSGVAGAGSAALYAIGGRTIANPVTIQSDNSTTLTIGSDSTTDDNTFTGDITIEKTANFNAGTGRNVTFSTGVLSGGGGLTKTGAGTVTLSGGTANTYSGLTTISNGTLNLNKSSGNAIAGAVTVNSGATLLLSGSDEVADTSAVTLSGGTIRRGAAVSEVFGNLNISSASTINFGSFAGSTFLQFGSVTGTGLTISSFLVGNQFRFTSTSEANAISTFGSFGFAGSDLRTTSWNAGTSTFTITAIPEPSTVVAAIGLAGLMLWPARRRLVRDAKSILGLRTPMRDRLASRHDHA